MIVLIASMRVCIFRSLNKCVQILDINIESFPTPRHGDLSCPYQFADSPKGPAKIESPFPESVKALRQGIRNPLRLFSSL